ncbi:MAG: recombination mediator RecR [Pseudomonadota bacterium]|jgi:recombination protein RecR
MATFSPLIDRLIQALRRLPGVGPRSAQRMALHLLERDRDGARQLAAVLVEAAERVARCRRCRTLTEAEECPICANPRRDPSLLCVVETPADVLAIEQSGSYQGRYFVLLGRLSPIDGLGPEELGIDQLLRRLAAEPVAELILATNLTVEGEATAQFIGEHAAALGVAVTRIAHGVPLGGELEHVDGGTLSHAFTSRRRMSP